MRKNIMKLIIFLSIIALSFSYVYKILSWKEADGIGITTFYKNKDNMIDVMFYGSSHCYCTINQGILWSDYGMASYNLAQSGQSFGSTYYYVEESLKTQSPKVMMVECVFISQGSCEDQDDAMQLYKSSLSMKWSKLYMENVKYQLKFTGSESDILMYQTLIKFPIIHSRYSSLTKIDFTPERYYSRGFILAGNDGWKSRPYDQPSACNNTTVGQIPEVNLVYLQKLVQLAKDNDIQLCLWIAPYLLTDQDQECFNAVQQFAEENGVAFVNFNTQEMIDTMKFDYKTDLMNFGHVNYYSSERITRYLGDYIHNTWGIEDKRGDSRYYLWDRNAEVWQAKKKSQEVRTVTDMDQYLGKVLDGDYTVVISLDGYYENGTHIAEQILSKYGIETNGNNTGQVFVRQNENTLFSAIAQESVWHAELGKNDIAVTTELYYDEDDGNIVRSKVNWNLSLNKGEFNAINVYVYDNVNEELVEMVSFAPENNYIADR